MASRNSAARKKIVREQILTENPVIFQVIGICSALAVTNLMMNSLIMGLALTFTTALSSFTISALREHTPSHIRMMVQVLIISFYVILVDLFLQAFMPDMSKALGPYVGLIITNCIIMGRAEAFAINNKPLDSLIDGAAAGIGYTLVLLSIALIREILGFGSVFGFRIMPAAFPSWTLMIMPPGAFFILSLLMWWRKSKLPDEEAKK